MRHVLSHCCGLAFVSGLLALGAAACLDFDLEDSGGPAADGTPTGVVDVGGIIPVQPLPGEPVRADDPAVVVLHGDGPGWEPGQSSFISADGQWATFYGTGWSMPYAPTGGVASASPIAEQAGQSVEQGDIYAVMNPETLVNLNTLRGLQVIDVSDLEHPRVVSRLPLAGTPLELYVVGPYAIVLLNGWQGHLGSSDEMLTDPTQGGVILVVDLGNPTAPRVQSQQRVDGLIAQSRLTSGGGDQALFVAASRMDAESYLWDTQLESYALSASGELTAQSALQVEGAVTVIQATPEAMLVARPDATNQHSRVLVVDISDPKGTMVAQADVTLAGFVSAHFNLDYRGGILRAASTAWTGSQTENHLQTFTTGSSAEAGLVDEVTFGVGQSMFATQFLEESAFIVTYLRVDPFHAFEIDATGDITERAEFIVSGWNDFFRPVLDETRMIGVGFDDSSGANQLALSLYDITDLSSEAPLIDRKPVPVAGAWSWAQYDHRAFTVLEGAVQAERDGGPMETGLLLLPVTGYDATTGLPVNGTQLFTFSYETLTPRGFMESTESPRRAFSLDDAAEANLGDHEIALFDAADPDEPRALGSTRLAPNYIAIQDFGDYWARVEDHQYDPGADYTNGPPPSELQIIPAGGDPDLAVPVATLEIPANTQTLRAGSSIVSLVSTYAVNADGTSAYETAVQVIDLSDPTAPRQAGSVTTEIIQPFYGYGYNNGTYGSYYGSYGYTDYCYGAYPSEYYSGCGCGGYTPTAEAYAVGSNTVVFVNHLPQQRLLGTEHACYSYPQNQPYCEAGSDCSVLSGYLDCRSVDGGPERCTNSVQRCRTLADGTWQCEALPDEDLASADMIETCYDNQLYRYWESYEIAVLDLSDPDAPVMRATLAMPTEEENTGLTVVGSDLYVNSRVPVEVEGDDRAFVRYFFRRIALADPAAPRVSDPVNVPGEVIHADGLALYTRDFAWGESVIEPAVNRVELAGNAALLRARRVFTDEEAYRVVVDGDGRLLVTHRRAAALAPTEPGFDWARWLPILSILDAAGDMSVTGEVELNSWMNLSDAVPGRALVTVPTGVLVLDLTGTGRPTPQAFFPSLGMPRNAVIGDGKLTFAAGPYGVYQFDLAARNLDQ